MTDYQRINKVSMTSLTQLSNLSYTARRAAGDGLERAVVIYWKVKDAEARRAAMDELGVSGMNVNGESVYRGSIDRLKDYVEKGLIKIRVKGGKKNG